MSDSPITYSWLLNDSALADLLKRSAEAGPDAANDFWTRFIYRFEINKRNYSTAQSYLLDLLNRCSNLDEEAYLKIHKGTPYYWLGTLSFLQNDFQTAVFFFDAAVSEDIRNFEDPISNPTPPILFLTLEGENENQAARPLVLAAQARVQSIIDLYNGMQGKSTNSAAFYIHDLRQHFLGPSVSTKNPEWRSLATAFISFALEWDYRNRFFDLRPIEGTSEPFFIHLFKGCLLFESLLKANPINPVPSGENTLSKVLKYLTMDLGLQPNDYKNISGANFHSIINGLEQADDSIRTAIIITGKVRNTVGHNLGWVVKMEKLQYQRLFFTIAVSCIHAISMLYPVQQND